jgi:type IV pilus assembly protein PilE
MHMPKRNHQRTSHPAGGFTLVELMIVIVIAGTLLAIAIPSYIDKVRVSRRTEAKTALLDLAGREERFFNTNNTYSSTPADLGYGAVSASFPMAVGSNYYTVNVTFTPVVVGPPMIAPTYTITATAINDQLKDKQCQTFTLTSTGLQTSTPNTTQCWTN